MRWKYGTEKTSLSSKHLFSFAWDVLISSFKPVWQIILFFWNNNISLPSSSLFFRPYFLGAFLLSSVEHSLIILFFKDRQDTNKLHRQRLCGLLQLCNARSLKGSNHDNTLKMCLCFGSLHDLHCLQRFVKEKAMRYNLVQYLCGTVINGERVIREKVQQKVCAAKAECEVLGNRLKFHLHPNRHCSRTRTGESMEAYSKDGKMKKDHFNE